MFYTVSKIYWMFASPILLLILGALIGALICRTRFGRLGQAVALVASLVLFALAIPPFAGALVSPLENRFPPPPADMPAPYGVVILGGALNTGVGENRGQATFTEGERVVEAALLARRFPQARILFTGGVGSPFRDDISAEEADEVRRLLIALGVDPSRIVLEPRSLNTEQNARFSAALVHPAPDQRWLLVTSAFHMPRSMGLFEKAGFNVVAWPVAFRTAGPGLDGIVPDFNPGHNIRTAELALREWIGLVAYRATGKIDRLFPGPDDRSP